MKDVFRAVPVTDHVWWVGAIDWAVRDFHGYLTSRGTTYNAYLIVADKVTLIDTVKASYRDEMLARIASVVPPKTVDAIVSNHSEPDHSGALVETIRALEPRTVYASKKGVEALNEYFGTAGDITPVEDGQTLDLGGASLTCAETKMCHWPDSMVSYLHEDRMLFSQDGFGMHLASYARFADEIDPWVLDYEARKYYANILLPLSTFIQKAIDKLQGLGVPIDVIAPDHGPIWRQGPLRVVEAYARYAAQTRTRRAVVVYDTMWESTHWMARAIGEGLAAGGAEPKLMPLGGVHRSDVATELLDAGALVAGAPTINNQMFPTLADCLTYVQGLKPKGLVGGVFGSYGWGGESTKHIQKVFEDMNVELVGPPVRAKYRPSPDTLAECYTLGRTLADRLAKNPARTPTVTGQ